MLIYGGRNDQAHPNPIQLDDIVMFDFEKKRWEAVNQLGTRPEGRWSASIVYDQNTE